MGLEGKVIIITGASRGIGRVASRAFAREGARVVAAARRTQGPGSVEETVREIRQDGGSALAIRCDVTIPSDVEALIDTTLKAFGQIDVLINNAGATNWSSIFDITVEEWNSVYSTNVTGVFLGCKYVLPAMLKQRSGNIINVSSSQAQKYTPNHLAYCSSKAAVDRFTLNLAQDVKNYNIAVNSYWPGHVISSMSRKDAHGNYIGNPEPTEVVLPSLLWLAQRDAATLTARILDLKEFGLTWGEGVDSWGDAAPSPGRG